MKDGVLVKHIRNEKGELIHEYYTCHIHGKIKTTIRIRIEEQDWHFCPKCVLEKIFLANVSPIKIPTGHE